MRVAFKITSQDYENDTVFYVKLEGTGKKTPDVQKLLEVLHRVVIPEIEKGNFGGEYINVEETKDNSS